MDYQAINILGLPSCIQLHVIRRANTFTRPVEERPSDGILAEYADVFIGLGCFPGEHHIDIDANFTPVIHAPHRIPLSLQPKIKHLL